MQNIKRSGFCSVLLKAPLRRRDVILEHFFSFKLATQLQEQTLSLPYWSPELVTFCCWTFSNSPEISEFPEIESGGNGAWRPKVSVGSTVPVHSIFTQTQATSNNRHQQILTSAFDFYARQLCVSVFMATCAACRTLESCNRSSHHSDSSMFRSLRRGASMHFTAMYGITGSPQVQLVFTSSSTGRFFIFACLTTMTLSSVKGPEC